MIFNKVFNKAPQKRTKNPVIANEAFRYRNGGGRPAGMAVYENWLQQISILRNVISTTAELASSAHIKFYKEDSKGKRGIFNNPKMFDKDFMNDKDDLTSFLYNYFDDQMNIIHIIVNGKRQSEKLNYPNRYLYKVF